jgi:hypothetical protein
VPIIDPTDLFNLRPRSELLPRRYPVEGVRVEAGAAVEAFRQELRQANIVCVGFNCVSITGTTATIGAVPQLSNDGANWLDMSQLTAKEFVLFAGDPSMIPSIPGVSGLGYVQAFAGIGLNPLGRLGFESPVGARFFRVLLVSNTTASGVFDVIGTAFFL